MSDVTYQKVVNNKPPEVKKETHYGVKFMCFTIVLLIASILINLISFLYFDPQAYPGILAREEWGIMILLAALSFIFWLGYLILFLISLFMFHRGKFEFGTKHTKNIKLAEILILCYFIIFILSIFLPISMFFVPLSSIVYFNGLWQAFYVLESFFLGFALLFLLKGFTNNRVKDILYLFVSLLILIVIIDSIVEILYFFPELYSDQLYRTYRLYSGILQTSRVVIWLLGFTAYYLTLIDFDPYSRFMPDTTSKFLPRPKPIADYIYKFYTKPILAFIIMLMISAVIGAGTVAAIDIDINPQDLEVEMVYEEQRQGDMRIYRLSTTGQLQEHTERSYEVPLEAETYCITVTLTWTDEADMRFRTNEPDTFTLQLNCGAYSESKTDQNPHGQTGFLKLSYDSSEQGEFIESTDILVSLDHAGDQTGPIGLGNSPLNAEDTSNEYSLMIEGKCIEYDVE